MDQSMLKSLDARRICIIKPSALGDVVQTLPLLPVLKERFPNAHISWVINHRIADVLTGHPNLDEIVPYYRYGRALKWMKLLWKLRCHRFDFVFDLQGLLRTGIMAAATRAPYRVHLETAREGSAFFGNIQLADTSKFVPAKLRYWRVAEALGMENRKPETIVSIPAADEEWAERLQLRFGQPFLAVSPGARWETKRWPAEKFAAVVAKAWRTWNFAVVIVGSSKENSLAENCYHAIRKYVPAAKVENLTGRTTIKQLAALLKRSTILLSNDSGPMHLAAGFHTPVVGVFTCTDPYRSGPPESCHQFVTSKVSCAGSYRKRCPYADKKKLACFDEIDVERVWKSFYHCMNRNFAVPRAA